MTFAVIDGLGVGVAVGVGEGAAVAVGELLAPVPVVVEPHAARINRLAVAPKKTRCRFMFGSLRSRRVSLAGSSAGLYIDTQCGYADTVRIPQAASEIGSVRPTSGEHGCSHTHLA